MLGELLKAVLAAVTAAATAVSATPMPEPDAARLGPGPVVGADISWPNCPKGLGIPSRETLGKPLPRGTARFVVIGLTNGPAFHPNPCLASHVEYARERQMWASAYAVATYPTDKQLRLYGDAGPRSDRTLRGRLYNSGYAQAKLNVAEMQAVGLDSPAVWVDVEPVSPPAPWTARPRLNKPVVDGVLRAYRDAGLRVGFYSVATLWRQIMGGTRYGLPEWRSAGPTNQRRALGMCRTGRFQGGRAVIGQWWDDDRDHNVLCPGTPAEDVLDHWFVKF
ncbi:hypothetical protein [Nocardioides iriomotensis]|uniref:DUF1906 domain-containing protein n=1 Tax=Nocardioides iriomotensis TaxID=715784 RepID=A0A4Q5IXD5_9ACTN|nr:hypothetical protein [Nocardioides iriomotensis]RYU10820.1 hypothetical protein ETU37_16390 [Nocardioides iriomotensis]